MTRNSTETEVKTTDNDQGRLVFQADGGEKIQLPSSEFISDAKMVREGDDLVLEAPNGEVAVIEGYFNAEPAPLLQSPDGAMLSPSLVQSFAHSPMEYAANETANDQSPIGAAEEVKGNATVTRTDGTVETLTNGTPIYQGDVVETDANGAVNIVFIDETSMAVSANARLAIDEYTYDPATESGTTNFSVLRGLFVFTSGLIGRDDPDDVKIDTPVGSIGIRGTIIAGEINPGGDSNISVLEGAIVITNGTGETTLSKQFETIRLGGFDEPMKDMGVLPASDIAARFSTVSDVNPSLFTMINDAVKEQAPAPVLQTPTPEAPVQSAPEQSAPQVNSSNTPQDQTPAVQTQAQAQVDAPVVAEPAAPELPPVAPMESAIASLNDTSSSGLPSANIVAGQPSTGLAGTASAPSTVGTAPVISAPAPAAIAPAAGEPANTPSTTTPNVADNIQPPPAVVNGPAAPTPPVFGVTMTGNTISELAAAGTVVGSVDTGVAGTIYRFSSGTTTSPDGYFQMVTGSGTSMNVILTTAGALAFGSTLNAISVANLVVNVTGNLGETASGTFGVTVTDSNAATVVNLDNPGAVGVTVISDTINNNVGFSITALGDINNDGFDDFAFTNNTNTTGQNHIYKVMGGASHIASGDTPTLATGGTIQVTSNPTPMSNFGETVIAGIGDFNGDGTEDYVIGQNLNTANGFSSGNAAIVSGMNTAQNIQFTSGTTTSGKIGAAVAGIGDFNNDGYADVLVGAPEKGGTGVAYVVRGGTDWNLDLGTLGGGGTNWGVINGGTSSGFGSSLTGLGDFNGDGYSDFAIGAPTQSGNLGSVSIYYGTNVGLVPTSAMVTIDGGAGQKFGSEMFSLGDVNGDGLSDLMFSDVNGQGYMVFGGMNNVGATFNSGSYVVSGGGGVGDFNADGYDDFTVSLSDGGSSKTYLVFGSATMGGNHDLNFLKNPANAIELKYGGAIAGNDLETTGVGDLNGDGYDDLAIGVPDANGGATGNGGVMLLYGHSTGANVDRVIGTAGDNVLSDGSADDKVLIGGAGDDMFEINNTNFLGINGGTNTVGGYDTIKAMGSLDFRTVHFESISGIERMQFDGTGKTITLSLENIFNLLKTSDTGSLKIDSAVVGNFLSIDASTSTANASISQIQGALGEHSGGTVNTSTAAGYNEFSIGGYKLYIDTDVAVAIQ